MIRFDYSGHGESGGAFADGTIGRWLEESLAVFDACCRGPQVLDRLLHGRLAGAPLARALTGAARARRRTARSIAGLVLIAPAVDFTEELMWKRFPPEVKRAIVQVSRMPAGWCQPRALVAGVREAPRHEVAGGGRRWCRGRYGD